jgi:hypothetical protein
MVLSAILIAATGCGGSPKPTPVFLPFSELDPSHINQLITTEGILLSTDGITCQTLVWVEGGKKEVGCTGFQFGNGPSGDWIDLALKRRGKSGLIIDYGINNQQFNLYNDLKVFDSMGEDRLDTGEVVQVTGSLYWPEGSGPTMVVEIIELVE